MEINAERCSEGRAETSEDSGPLETADRGCVAFVDRDLALRN